jgi:phage shock protein A
MSLTILLLIAVGAFIVMFTKPGVLIKGIYHTFVKDMAATPEGAEAIYTTKIENMEKRQVQATEALEQIAGQLSRTKNEKEIASKKVVDLERQCEALARAGKFDDVEILAAERDSLVMTQEELAKAIADLEPMFKDAQEVLNLIESQLKKLKAEKITVVNNLRRNIMVTEMYHTLDGLKKSSVDKMLADAREGAQAKTDTAAGAKALHDSKLSTKVERAQASASSAANSDYVAQLRARYGSGAAAHSAENKLGK